MASHVVIFPFMSKGHTIPLLHLTRLLLRRSISVSIITTPSNSPFIKQSLIDTDASLIILPFPQNIPQLPSGIESTDKLPSMSLFLPFANAIKLMQPDFEQTLNNLSNLSCIISDGFLGWTQHSAWKMGIPRYVLYGMNHFSPTISRIVARDRPHANVHSDDEPFSLPEFPWIKITKNDLDPSVLNPEGPMFDFVNENKTINMQSRGFVTNSFYELESKFVDHWNNEYEAKSWCVGPLCLAEPPKCQSEQKPFWIHWLDERLEKGETVLYVAFGSQAGNSEEQLEEIAVGLEKSQVNFLWVVRSKGSEAVDRVRDRVKGRGLIVSEWVGQVEILNHESVKGFMSHCGWNSVMESICASVPILAWPMMVDQHLNARLVVEELGVGVRVLARNGSVRGFVGSDCIEKMATELMEGDKGRVARKKMEELGEVARKSVVEGESSWCTLDLFINDWSNTFQIQKRKS